ncbi:MAG: FAD-binding protein, partial [Phycisphaerales bacterium]|nr:FAD-binding protein [Phycisphaerales bacterium]
YAEFKLLGISLFNRYHMLSVIKLADGKLCGVLCTQTSKQKDADHGLILFNCTNLVIATGGPGDLYEISVYPKGQMGSYSQLLEAGARAHNLTESQFGLASLNPRWNLSGTYQQVIPRYYSTDKKGNDEQEFLNPWFNDMATLATDIFLKGYQWPFDHDKIANHGSSLIDILVQNEMVNKGRRVFMDFRENPRATGNLQPFKLEDLKPEALEYLQKSGALQATPIERLAHMNQPSIDLYTHNNPSVDLWKEPLEIGVCSQHCNGGFAVDNWWESTVPHLFVVGELAGTHGVKRPGGSALNSGQVGSMRAAQRIAHAYNQSPISADQFQAAAAPAVECFNKGLAAVKAQSADALDAATEKKIIQHRMSKYGGMVRSLEGVKAALAAAREQNQKMCSLGLKQKPAGFMAAVETYELALAQVAYLESILAVLEKGGGSRGSHLVTDPNGNLPHPNLTDEWRFIPENMELRQTILGIVYNATTNTFTRTESAPNGPPTNLDDWFENTWAAYRKAEVFRKEATDTLKPYKIYA